MRDDELNNADARHARALRIAKSRQARNVQLSARTEPTFSYSRPSSYEQTIGNLEDTGSIPTGNIDVLSGDETMELLAELLSPSPREKKPQQESNASRSRNGNVPVSENVPKKEDAAPVFEPLTQNVQPSVPRQQNMQQPTQPAQNINVQRQQNMQQPVQNINVQRQQNIQQPIQNAAPMNQQRQQEARIVEPRANADIIQKPIVQEETGSQQRTPYVSVLQRQGELNDAAGAQPRPEARSEEKPIAEDFIEEYEDEEEYVEEREPGRFKSFLRSIFRMSAEEKEFEDEVKALSDKEEEEDIPLPGEENPTVVKEEAPEAIAIDGDGNGNDPEDPDGKKNRKKKKKKNDVERPKGKKSTFILAILTSIALFIFICGVIGAGAFAWYLCKDMPDLKAEDLVAPDSSVIYDREGNKIMEIGMYLRENVDYEEMPNSLIDAFLAIEDSRYFGHIGFDIPRFTKALLANIRTRDFSQGGSTITMQLIKNTYYSIDADSDSTIASREGMSGIKRKMQEIVMAIETNFMKNLDKRKIMAMYINKVNYGDNIRGVEKAAEYYFGKRSTELTLGESAFLAGLINSPSSYNPYNDLYKYDSIYLDPDSQYLKNGQDRRDEVLDLMVYHGYISKEEADLEKSVRIEDLLKGVTENFQYTNESYQWYIDAVIDEAIDSTGESPYAVGMDIYTNMSPYLQKYVYDMQNEAEYTGIEFPNELCQSAIVLMNNQDGSIIALGGGRGEIDSARQFNRATSAYLNPGSSIKPIIDYALAIEKLGWATTHVITDMPYYLYDGPVLISNYDHQYHGDMTILEALARSQNTPAVQTLAAVVNEIGEEAVVDYMNSIGYDFEYEDFDLQFAIGGNRCLVTPLQMAGAHAMFMNGGRYIKPHTIDHIKYVDGREDFVADTKGNQLLSEETAYMMAFMENYNMDGSFSSLMWYCKRDYPLYGKTGTTDWADSGLEYGIPEGSTKDSWLVMQTNQYTISCWTGYDKLQEGAYFSNAEYQENTKSKLVSKILDELETNAPEEYDPYRELVRPEGVVDITHVLGAYPYCYPSGGYQTVTGLISAKALEEHPLVSVGEVLSRLKTKVVSSFISSVGGAYDGLNIWVSVGVAGASTEQTGEFVDISETNAYNETTHAVGRSYFPHYNYVFSGEDVSAFSFNIIVDGNIVFSNTTSDFNMNFQYPGSKAKACVWTDDPENPLCADLN